MTPFQRQNLGLALGFGLTALLVWLGSPTSLFWGYLPLFILLPATVAFVMRHVLLGNYVILAHTLVIAIFAFYSHYVLGLLDRIAPEPAFDFSVVSFNRMRMVVALNYLVLAVGITVIAAHARLSIPTASLRPAMMRDFLTRYLTEGRIILLTVATGLIALLVAFISPNVLTYPYPMQARQPWFPPVMLFNVLLALALMAMISAYLRAGRRPSVVLVVITRCLLYGVVAMTLLVGGGRGGAFSLLIAVVFLDYGLLLDRRRFTTSLVLIADIFLLFFMLFNWPEIRGRLYIDGLDAVWASFSAYADFISGLSGARTSNARLGETPMLGQSLFHWLYAMQLVEIGQSRALQTFINLLPQLQPTIMDGLLWTRPPPDAELLRRYFHHGGGLFVYANAYWNGGLLVTLCFAAVLYWLMARIDLLYKQAAPVFLASYFVFLVLVPVTTFYGIQALARALEYGLLAYLLTRVVGSRHR